MKQVSRFLFILLPWIPGLLYGMTTQDELTVLEGNSVTIPCHYEPEYGSYVKYWCRGKMREFCTSLARTDDSLSDSQSEDKVSIFDDPIQEVFTVTMKNLKEEDSGWYMCGVELGGFWKPDISAFIYVKVTPGMSVVKGMLSEEEGHSVTVQCLYSVRYRESEKKWCRSGDWSSCLVTGHEGSYEDTSVAISDDRTGTLTITMKKLHMSDMGWYWCSAGQQQIAVHVQVLHRPSTTAVTVTSRAAASEPVVDAAGPKHITKDCGKRQIFTVPSVMMCVSLMLLVALPILARRMWKHSKQNNNTCSASLAMTHPLHKCVRSLDGRLCVGGMYAKPEQFAKIRQTMGMKARHKTYKGGLWDLGDLQKNPAVVFLNINPSDAKVY
ncbi:polymeric immunoglobulin receptor-like isoform X2 [Phyllopteryx taeniolatus]|uniref:polymeric immunoglobulin receptor-like isoform X2 n=1 Tax=Phyllopteryx taeniolatus TaxID=161469 RepID=UPI002AD21415|nr:polymeric immunoglobulin receptor-like isoform X2 [Phyllopteryx taeniolatus]